MEFNFSIENDTLIRNTVIPQEGEDNVFLIKKEPIITKDAFVECYNQWMGGNKHDTAAE